MFVCICEYVAVDVFLFVSAGQIDPETWRM